MPTNRRLLRVGVLLLAYLISYSVNARMDTRATAPDIEQQVIAVSNSKTATKIEKIKNWQRMTNQAETTGRPIVVLLERSNCGYCEVVIKEFLTPLSNSRRYKDRLLFARISLDKGQQLIDQSGETISTRQFGDHYGSNFSPTVLFLDANGNQLAENLIGMNGRDYYGYYLEKGINKALTSLEATARTN